MSTYIIDIVEEDIICCGVCNKTFDTNEITTDDFSFAWDNVVHTDCCNDCFNDTKKTHNLGEKLC